MDALAVLEEMPGWFDEEGDRLAVESIEVTWDEDATPEVGDYAVINRKPASEKFEYKVPCTAREQGLCIQAQMPFMAEDAWDAAGRAGLEVGDRLTRVLREVADPVLHQGWYIQEGPSLVAFYYERLLHSERSEITRQEVIDTVIMLCNTVSKTVYTLEDEGLYGIEAQEEERRTEGKEVSPPVAPEDTPLGSTGGIRGIQ